MHTWFSTGLAAASALLVFGVGGAHAQVDVTTHRVTCNTINGGLITLIPPLKNTGGGTTIKIKGKLGGCTDLDDASVVFQDLKSTFSGTLTNPASPGCAGLIGSSPATGTITIKWKTVAPGITPKTSTVTVTSGDVVGGLFVSSWGGAYGQFNLGNPPGGALDVSGAFTGGTGGTGSAAIVLSNEDAAVLANACAGVGLKKVTIGLAQLKLQ